MLDNQKTHKLFSASNISDSLSSKRKTRKQSKEKSSKTSNLPLNVTEGIQTQHEDYNVCEAIYIDKTVLY